jgi:hypothetical protein
MLKKISTIGYVTALATSPTWMTGCTLSSSANTPAEKPTVLFSLTSDAMHFENPSPSKVTLVMEGVDPSAIWFTDRPVRESGVMSTSQLTAKWNDGATFQVDPPNAALVLHEPVLVDGNSTETLVVEILDAHYDQKNESLRAELKVLTDEGATKLSGNLSAHGNRHDSAWPNRAGAVSLFIDSVTQGTTPPTRPTPTSTSAHIVLCSNPATCGTNTTQNITYNSTIYFSATDQQATKQSS